ncbi:AbiH family protein (plasmid) [Enterococcus faecalis]|uniref:AbiH family protein n=1 Tax=Enterococcus faecalis TaxID=1351 RepID=UPI0024AE43CC|nr:AbiH family protein [Enterococcus faecalis]WHK76487.1 AbiH family protein [Enterococcus faecalis]
MEHANQIIILGNGFDLACDLKSSYNNFLKFQMENVKPTTTFESIKQSIDSIDEKEDLDLIKNNQQVSEKLKEIYSTGLNIWTLLLINYYDEKDEKLKWQDIEEKIHFYLKKHLIKLTKGPQFHEYIQSSREIRNAVILVKGLALFRKVAINSNEKIAEFLLEELHNLEKIFNNYLFENAGYIGATSSNSGSMYFDKAHNLLEKLANLDVNSAEKIKYNVMSFNYTNPWDSHKWSSEFSINSSFTNPIKYINVHGEAVKDHKKSTENVNRIIFGIDNKDIETSSEEYIFTKKYRTLVNYSDTSKSTRATDANIFDNSVKIIKFFGHSLGDADYRYFQQMFDYYNLYGNDDLKLYFYFRPYDDKISITEYLHDQSIRVIKLLDKYGKTMTNKDHGKNLVTRLEMTKRIFIKEI